MSQPEPPHVCAFLVCDHLWQDRESEEWHVQGVLEVIRAEETPVPVGPFDVYANLTNMRGRYRVRVSILRANDEVEVAEARGLAPFWVESPLDRAEINFRVRRFTVHETGRLLARLFVNGSPAQDMVVSVLRPGEQP